MTTAFTSSPATPSGAAIAAFSGGIASPLNPALPIPVAVKISAPRTTRTR